MHAVATTLSTRIYLRLQEIHTAAVEICLLPSVTRVTSLQSKGVPKTSGRSFTAPGNYPSDCLVSATPGKGSIAANSKARIKVSGAAGITGKQGDKAAGKQVGNFLPPGSRRRSRRNTLFPHPPHRVLHPAGSIGCPPHSQYRIMQLLLLC